MTAIGDRSMRETRLPSAASPYLGAFDKLWSQRTILLTQQREGEGAPILPTGGTDSPPGGSGLFPVTVRATYMDSTLIDNGLQTFAELASMSGEERSQFRSIYKNGRASGDSLFVWLELETSATEEFLTLDRWTMFLENEEGRQFEPARIRELPIQRQRRQSAEPDEPRAQERDLSGFAATARKEVELYFRQIPGESRNPAGAALRTLRFIMFETKNPVVRAEGAWQVTVTAP